VRFGWTASAALLGATLVLGACPRPTQEQAAPPDSGQTAELKPPASFTPAPKPEPPPPQPPVVSHTPHMEFAREWKACIDKLRNVDREQGDRQLAKFAMAGAGSAKKRDVTVKYYERCMKRVAELK